MIPEVQHHTALSTSIKMWHTPHAVTMHSRPYHTLACGLLSYAASLLTSNSSHMPTSKQASTSASQPASKQVSQPASQPASKQASQPASQQASKQTMQ
jgi:hypothetical protein